MSLPNCDDTIVAICTPAGSGGIGVIRISGVKVFPITSTLLQEEIDFSQVAANSVHYAHIRSEQNQRLIDEVLISVFKAPKSYTGEDVIEISAHGNPLLLRQILNAAIDAGARQATPGEFTLRAFESGRIDLVQAEAVADLVAAAGELSQRSAIYQLTGKLSAYIESIRSELLEIAALFEAYTDFPEEEIPAADRQQLLGKLDAIGGKLSRLANSYRIGKVYRNGIQIPIVGPVNAGKSSLFNAMLAEERAIVTEIPGTTRDTISETIELAGLPVRLIDTAGLREAADLIESIGIERSRREIAASSILLLVYDATLLTGNRFERAASELEKLRADFRDRDPILVLNKSDLLSQSDLAQIMTRLNVSQPLALSAKNLEGVDRLLDLIRKRIVSSGFAGGDDNTLTNERHFRAVSAAAAALSTLKGKLSEEVSFEFLAFDLRQAIEPLEEMLGKISSEEMLSEIFGRFCIGK